MQLKAALLDVIDKGLQVTVPSKERFENRWPFNESEERVWGDFKGSIGNAVRQEERIAGSSIDF